MATRGRKPGVKIGPIGPQVGSMPWQLSRLAVGERLWVESTPAKCAGTQRQATLYASRVLGSTFITRTFTAMPKGKLGVVHTLIMIERTL